MQFISWVNSWVLLLLFILVTCFMCWDTWEGHHPSVCSMLMIVRFSSMLTRTPLGRVIQQIVDQLQAIVFFLALLLLHGSQRSKQPYLDLVQRQNFEHWLLLLKRLYGFNGCWLILVFHVMPHTSSLWQYRSHTNCQWSCEAWTYKAYWSWCLLYSVSLSLENHCSTLCTLWAAVSRFLY